MTPSTTDIERCKALLAEALGTRTSDMLRGRLTGYLDKWAAGTATFEQTQRLIRIALRLFIGEDVADVVTERLRVCSDSSATQH